MKSWVLLAVLAVVAIAAAYVIFSKPAYPLTEEDAKKYFLEDLAERYPDAEVREVVEIVPLTASDGSQYFQLKARVTKGFTTPCPERIDVHYDYPPKNFVAQPPEYITKGCQICINEPVCTIAFPEEAIIASHTLPGAEQVAQFIRDYSDAKPFAAFEESYNGEVGVWLVTWTSASTQQGYRVAVSKSQKKVIEVATYSG